MRRPIRTGSTRAGRSCRRGANGAPTIGLKVDRDGKSMWVFDRCGANDCAGSNIAPIQKFDATGKLVTSFGAGMFNYPARPLCRQGRQRLGDRRRASRTARATPSIKFSPDGKVLMTLGKPGVAGDGPTALQRALRRRGRAERRHLRRRRPWRQHQRPHREVRQGRQVHQDLGQEGQGAGRVRRAARARDGFRRDGCSSPTAATTASRSSIRTASSSPSGSSSAGRAASSSTRTTCIYVADSQSSDKLNPGFKQGIRIGSAKDGKVTAFIPRRPRSSARSKASASTMPAMSMPATPAR